MTTFLSTPDFSGYTELSFEDTKAAVVDGLPIVCWWYSSEGKRHEERFIFTDFRYISTCSELS